jgi:hypothetical protein
MMRRKNAHEMKGEGEYDGSFLADGYGFGEQSTTEKKCLTSDEASSEIDFTQSVRLGI